MSIAAGTSPRQEGMTSAADQMLAAGDARLSLALQALALLAVDPAGLGGAVLKGPNGPVSEQLCRALRDRFPGDTAWRKLPPSIGDERLIGGLDLTATLALGRPVLRKGLLAEADGGVLIAPMTERLDRNTVSRLTAALDEGLIRVERDGFQDIAPARFALIAMDEGHDADEAVAPALTDRLAFLLNLEGIRATYTDGLKLPGEDEITKARALLPGIGVEPAMIEGLCKAALALGVLSLRAPLFAARAARALAAFDGRTQITDEDIGLAATLIIAPRAIQLPPAEDADAPPEEQDAPDNKAESDDKDNQSDRPLEDVILDAVRAALPEKLLAGLIQETRSAARQSGGAGALGKSAKRGRPIGSRRGELRHGERLALLDTLRAAAPWQSLRQRERNTGRIQVRRDDLRIRRFKQQAETTTIFVVDASGSAAINRLAEAKGAIELLLADCYVRRDSVQLIAFRAESADIILPPTRSLVRAKRSLAGLPGGGGTPLAAALDAARDAAREAQRRGQTAIVVVLSDGKANICRDGQADRARAHGDATASARAFSLGGATALFIDTSPRPQPQAREIAAAMRARYLPLPQAEAKRVSEAVRQLAAGTEGH